MRLISVLVAVFIVLAVQASPAEATSSVALVKDINATQGSAPTDLVAVGDRIAFSADDGVHGRELWRSDGSPGGTFLVADAHPGPSGSDPDVLAGSGANVFFTADDGVHGRELWSANLTSGHAQLVKNITSGSAGTQFGYEAAFLGDKLFFEANARLWVTDGSATGTRRVGPSATALLPFSGRMYFLAGEHPYNQLVWRSDGTAGGTRQVTWSPQEANELAATDTALFILSGMQTPMQNLPPTLWRTDGTTAGTTRLTQPDQLDQAGGLVTTKRQAFFFDEDYDADEIMELWRSNGSVSGTRSLKVVPMPSASANPIGMRIFFFGFSNGNWALWKSGGKSASTLEIDTFDAAGGEPAELTGVGTQLCFYTRNYDTDMWTLWASNGSIDGARPVATSSHADRHPTHLAAAGSKLYFSLDDGTGPELWAYTR